MKVPPIPTVSAHHRLGRLHSSCEFDSRCDAFPVFFVKIRTLYIGLVRPLKPKARAAFTVCSRLARTPGQRIEPPPAGRDRARPRPLPAELHSGYRVWP
jgi:hypothetical protein